MIRLKDNVEKERVTNPEASDAFMKVLVGPKEGWKGYVMREFELKANGYTPRHAHNWPHINYIVSGEGTLEIDGALNVVKAGDSVYIPNNAMHQFKNNSNRVFRFLCIVPEDGHQ
ncbi:cupin domain-containing protein [Guggenheimella bovis]